MKYFTAAWPDPGARVWVFLCNVSTQELYEETKVWDRVCLKNIQNIKILMKCFTVAWPDSEARISIQCQYIHKVPSFIIFIQNWMKPMQINLLVKQEIHAATVRTNFSWFPWKQTSSYMEKSKFADESWQPQRSFRW